MGPTSRKHRRERRTWAALQAAAEAGPFRCNAAAVAVEPAVLAAEGRAARRPRFTIDAYTGGLLRVGWGRPVVIDLAGLRAGRTTILLDHNPAAIVGQGQATIDAGRVTVAGEITGDPADPATPAGIVAGHARNGFIWAASVGVEPERVEAVEAGATAAANGQEFPGPCYVVRAGRLGEVSFVGIGADEHASATVAATAHPEPTATLSQGQNPMNFSAWLTAKGHNEATLTADEIRTLYAQYLTDRASTPAAAPAAPVTPPTPAAPPAPIQAAQSTFSRVDAEIAEGRRRQALEDMTIAQIRAHGHNPQDAARFRDLLAHAIDAGTSVRDYDLELLRAGRPIGPTIGEPRAEADLGHTLHAAALLASRQPPEAVARELGERTVDAAQRRFGRNLGLQEIILAAANANGYNGRQRIHTGNWREVMAWAIPTQQLRAAGLSSIDLSGILGNVANKALAAVAAEPQWLVPQLCGVANHSNFYAHTVYSLAMNGELKEVAPSGTLDNLSLGQESYTRQLGTRGAMLRLSRQDIINDDLGVFDRNANALARKALTTREKVFFTLLLASGAGASHFTAARGNYVTGAGSAFGTAGMGAALKAFRNLTGPDGDPVMVEPSIVLVPPTLEQDATALLAASSTLVVTGLASTSAKGLASGANIYAGKFGGRPLVSPWLENTGLTGYSTAYWYMFANPAVYPCYEIAYLNGQQAPTVEYFGLETEADNLGVAWRVYWDFGVAAAEYRAGCKMAGA